MGSARIDDWLAFEQRFERLEADGSPLGRDARHYIDLHALAGEEEVREMLRSPEYREIKEDHERIIGLEFFKKRFVSLL